MFEQKGGSVMSRNYHDWNLEMESFFSHMFWSTIDLYKGILEEIELIIM